MTLQKEDIENLLLRKKKNGLSGKEYIPTPGQPTKARASYLARFFDDYIESHSVKPDKSGSYTFSLLKRELVKYAGSVPDTYFRTLLKDFGYHLRYHNKWVSVTKQYT
jgi:hypothetical protein